MNTELPESLLIGSVLAEPPEANVLNPPTLPGSFLPRADRGNEPGNVSGVHNIQMSDCVSWVCLCSSTRRSKRAFVANFARRTRKVTLACNWECDYSTVCAAELIGWVVSGNLGILLDMPLVQVLQVKYVQGLHSFIGGRWSKFSEGVRILQ